MATTLEQKRREAAKREKARKEKIANRKKNIGKEGYDRYGVLTAAGKKAQDKKTKEQKAAKARAKANAREMAREREGIKSRAESKKQVEKIRKTTNNFGKGSPQKTAAQKKREKSNTLAKPKVSGRKKLVEVTSDTSGLKKQKGSEASKKQISKKDRRRNLRAAGLATRKGISLEDAKKLQEKRRDNRKQFLRNFAANLAGVEQNTVRGQINTQDMSDAYKGKPDVTKAQESETAENEKSYKNRLFFNPEPNKGLGEVGIDLTGAGIIGRYDKT